MRAGPGWAGRGGGRGRVPRSLRPSIPRTVEELLRRGADPNLVLEDGAAASRLAARPSTCGVCVASRPCCAEAGTPARGEAECGLRGRSSVNESCLPSTRTRPGSLKRASKDANSIPGGGA